MADRYLLESGAPDGYLLEDGTGVLLLDIPPPGPTIDATSTSGWDTNVSTNSVTWTHTCSGANRVLVVIAFATDNTQASVTASTCTYNGDSLSLETAAAFTFSAGASFGRTTIFTLVAPDTGSAFDITITFAGNCDRKKGIAISLNDASQGGVYETAVSETSDVNEFWPVGGRDVTLTIGKDGSLPISAMLNAGSLNELNAGSGQTRIHSSVTASSQWSAASYRSRSFAGSVDFQWSGIDDAGPYALIAFGVLALNVKPVVHMAPYVTGEMRQ